MNWMAWTLPTAIFFSTIGSIIVMMTVWEIRSPCIERKGFLPISTTRGDRLFIGLLSSAFILLFTLGFTSLIIWLALVASVIWLISLMRWG